MPVAIHQRHPIVHHRQDANAGYAKRVHVLWLDDQKIRNLAVRCLDEVIEEATVRYRTVGDATLTGAVRSDATTVEDIIHEVSASRISERGATRGDDRFSETSMEDRKREGYF